MMAEMRSAERFPVQEVARRVGVGRPAVWRWQMRYAEQGVDGLLRDRMRESGRTTLPRATVAKALARTCSAPTGAATHSTSRAVAKAVGISLRAVKRIREANRLQPHRIRTVKALRRSGHCRQDRGLGRSRPPGKGGPKASLPVGEAAGVLECAPQHAQPHQQPRRTVGWQAGDVLLQFGQGFGQAEQRLVGNGRGADECFPGPALTVPDRRHAIGCRWSERPVLQA